ncbi:MAG: hypothetical protein QHG98_01760 [Methanothrix sp.]|uniref:hypothetical protein n=1 Tax=Methanothrix sp. TaxID=90426 RepID=UPI00247DEC84|nr:hypothetical protein [Methanothrix sp.]
MVRAATDTMDVSFSSWKLANENKGPLPLSGDSFSFLFDRRYTNRLNRMSRVFFEAYAKATAELAVSEDRFPSLSEVEAKMESGAVYAFKDRLMKNTQFFDEVKISGVSYLVPRAYHFVDSSGIYTDLIFDFEKGSVTLPSRRKVPLLKDRTEIREPQAGETAGEEKRAPEREVEPAGMEVPGGKPAAEEIPEAEEAAPVGPAEPSEMQAPPRHDVAEALYMEEAAEPSERTHPPIPPVPQATPGEKAGAEEEIAAEKGPGYSRTQIGILLAALLIAAGIGVFFIYSPFLAPAQIDHVMYAAYISNSTNESILNFDIENSAGIQHEVELILPENIDRSVIARGGTVTVSHYRGTVVRMSSSGDSSIKVYLSDRRDYVPVVLSVSVPEGYDSGIVVHGRSYEVIKKDRELELRLNVTSERVEFDQSYMRTR